MALTDDELNAQAAELCAGAADDFLFGYLALAPATNGAILSRLFAMAHCIELSIKAALFAQGLDASRFNHELEAMLKKDAALWAVLKPLMPSNEAKAGFRRYVDPAASNINMDDAMLHREEFEIQCCLHFAQDLKYSFGRDKNLLMRAGLSPLPLNRRFLTLIGHIRLRYPRFEMWQRFFYGKFETTGVRANADVLKILHETLGVPKVVSALEPTA